MMTHSSKRRGFTLIELLVVIAIIGLLMAILFPAINGVLKTVKRNQARGDAMQIAAAINMYWNEYGRLPVELADQRLDEAGEDDQNYFTQTVSREIIEVLIGENADLNPKEKVFLNLQTPDVDGTFLDPWDTQYYIKLDRDYNMKIRYGNVTGRHGFRAVVVSAGPDRNVGNSTALNGSTLQSEAEDNIANVDFIDD